MDWFAAIFELLGAWLIGNKKKVAFIPLMVCNVLWITVAVSMTPKLWGLATMMMAFLFINIRNYRKWSQDAR